MLAALALFGFGGVLALGKNSGIGLGPLDAFPVAMYLAVLGACLAGLFESLLAVLWAGSRVTMFFTLRDLTTPIVILGLIVVLRPTSAVSMIGVYAVVWAVVFFGALGYLVGFSKVMPKSGRTSLRRWRTLLRHTGGLVYGNFGSRLSIYIDVLVLTYVVSLDQVGEYRAAAQFAIGFMVVQHFMFLGLPWQMRRVGQVGKPGPGYIWVDSQQRMLLLLAGVATVLLWLLAGPILSLLGPRFVDVAPLFRLFVLIRFVDLLWGPTTKCWSATAGRCRTRTPTWLRWGSGWRRSGYSPIPA